MEDKIPAAVIKIHNFDKGSSAYSLKELTGVRIISSPSILANDIQAISARVE
ncbi:MAG TPA: hypothetical protein VF543_15680 [Pyrinomonadaceae bacterium]